MATSSVRRVGAAGLVLGLCLGAANTVPATASTGLPLQAVVGGLLGGGDGGLLGLGGLVGGLLNGEGGIFGHEGGVIAGDDELSDVVEGFGSDDGFVGGGQEILGAVTDVVSAPNIGGEGSFGGGNGLLGGTLGGLLSGGTGLLGGVF